MKRDGLHHDSNGYVHIDSPNFLVRTVHYVVVVRAGFRSRDHDVVHSHFEGDLGGSHPHLYPVGVYACADARSRGCQWFHRIGARHHKCIQIHP